MTAKEKLLKIVANAKGDDLERAERAFQGLSQKEMNEQHGRSSMTRQALIEAYRLERVAWRAAYDLAKSL